MKSGAFTGAPLGLASGHFGLGHGGGALRHRVRHRVGEPGGAGYDGAVMSFAEYPYELAE